MRKFTWIWTAILSSCLTLTSCSIEDNPANSETPTPATEEDMADYTVIFYTTGGGNLDASIEKDLVALCGALGENNKQVRVITQYKYSKELSKNFSFSGAPGQLYRYELDAKLLNKSTEEGAKLLLLTDDMLYGTQQANSQLYQPDSIANFINYCVKAAPAHNYVFMISDHGAGYQIAFDYDKSKVAATRGLMTDDNLAGNPNLTNREMLEGIKKSGVRMKMLNFDCCLMNNLETLSELMGVADYVIASGHSTYGQDQEAFVEMLKNAGVNGENLMEYGQKFVNACAKKAADHKDNHVTELDPRAQNVDFNITDMSKFPTVLSTLAIFTNHLMTVWQTGEFYENTEVFHDAANNCYQYNPEAPLYDAADYLRLLAEMPLKNYGEFAQYYQDFYKACKSAIVCHAQSLASSGYEAKDLTYSITLGCQGFIGVERDISSEDYPAVILGLTMDGKPAKLNVFFESIEPNTVDNETTKAWYDAHQQAFAWANSYQTTYFDKYVGWSRWLEANPCYPYNNPPQDNRADLLGISVSKYDGIMAFNIGFSKETLKYFKIKFKFNQGTEMTVYSTLLQLTSQIPRTYAQNGGGWPATSELVMKMERKADKTGPWEINLTKNSYMSAASMLPSTELINKQVKYDIATTLTGTTEAEADEAASKFYLKAILYQALDGSVRYEIYDAEGNDVTETGWPFLNYVKSKTNP